jgi:PEP-CTERM motif-containing protein
MDGLKKVTLALATAGLLSSGVVQAELLDRGGGLLYDDVLNVTWLQDANYAKTTLYSADGKLTWSAANTWAANLSFYDSERRVYYTDWRLAANTPVSGANWNYATKNDGTSDVGWNITSRNSELSYMYYVNLGLKGFYSPTDVMPNSTQRSTYGLFGNGTSGGQADVGLVHNLQSNAYSSGTTYGTSSDAFAFATNTGVQWHYAKSAPYFVWAVRPGDVAPAIPEPEAYAMMLAGLGLLGFAARRRRQKEAA